MDYYILYIVDNVCERFSPHMCLLYCLEKKKKARAEISSFVPVREGCDFRAIETETSWFIILPL